MAPSLPLLQTALSLARSGLPVIPLSRGKRPVGNCAACRDGQCGDRPNMRAAGPCQCPRPCHGWSAATTHSEVIASPEWTREWERAGAVAYHPGGADFTIVDLDSAAAVNWARKTLPPTVTVVTARGEHWIYRGSMTSHNGVQTGVDIKSRMAYVRWVDIGHGVMTPLPDLVRALPAKEQATTARAASPRPAAWTRTVASGCRHTERYVRSGLDRGLAKVTGQTEQGAGSAAFGVARFLGDRHTQCPGPCGLEAMGAEVVAAAVAVGVPEAYAARAVKRGFATAGVTVP